MCDECGKSCVCSWLTDKDKKTIETKIKEDFGKYEYINSPEAQAKMQAMKQDIALLRQMNLDSVLGHPYNNKQENWDKIIARFISHYDTVDPQTISASASNDVVFARTLITWAKIEKKYGPGQIDIVTEGIARGNIDGLKMFGNLAIYLQATTAIPVIGYILPAVGTGLDGVAVYTTLKASLFLNKRETLLLAFLATNNPGVLSVFPEGIEQDGPYGCNCGAPPPPPFSPIGFIKYLLGLGATQPCDPLVLDLDGDGFETVSENTGITFDHDGDGFKTGTGWVNSDDGFLVYDRNGDGVINNGGELFGEYTELYDGSGFAKNAFEALAQEDSNGDGIINAEDANWNNLKVWRDLNQDGISQANELFTLEELGIAGINVGSSSAVKSVTGGWQTASGTYIKDDGTTGNMGQFDFSNNTFYREFQDKIEVPDDIQALPDMQGSGLVRDLQEAATLSPQLKSLLEAFSAADTRDAQLGMLEELLYSWAQTAGFQTFEERFGDAYNIIHNNVPAGDVVAWQRMVSILEVFNGQYFFDSETHWTISIKQAQNGETKPTLTINWNARQITPLQESWAYLAQTFYNALVLQTRFAPIADLLSYQITSSYDIVEDFSDIIAYFREQFALDPNGTLIDLMDFNYATDTIFKDLNWSGYELAAEFLSSTDAVSDEIAAYFNIVYANADDKATGATSNIVHERNYVIGADGNEALTGSSGNDVLYGDDGDDTLTGNNGNDILYGGDGNDTLNGGIGNDILDGGAGNDYLIGGPGNDTYVFARGYGHDRVNASSGGWESNDTVFLKDLYPDEVEFCISHDPAAQSDVNDLVIRIKDTGETITIINGLGRNTAMHIAYVKFGDGSVWTLRDVLEAGLHTDDTGGTINMWISSTVYAGSGNDKIYGTNGNDILYGGDGDDYLYSSNGDDVLYGGDGDDTLDGGIGDDILDGGAGNDYLIGGPGNDTYVFGRGYGHDRVNASSGGWESNDTVFLKDLNPDEVEFCILHDPAAQSDVNDLVIRIKDTGETITIINGLGRNTAMHIAYVKFGDGSVWTLRDVLEAGLHTDDTGGTINMWISSTVYAGSGNDTIIGTSGDDVLYGDAGDDTLKGGSGNDILYGGDGDDTLDGGFGDDWLDGGAGNDTLIGGVGHNTFVFGKGYGHDTVDAWQNNSRDAKWDTVLLKGLEPVDVEFLINGSNLVIRIKETGETMTILKGLDSDYRYRIDAISFANGETWSFDELLTNGLHTDDAGGTVNMWIPSMVYGGSGNDTITGSSGDDIIYGGEGDDKLYGGKGDDYLYGGDGDDYLDGGIGNNILDGGAGNDQLYGGSGSDNTYVFGRGYGHDLVHLNYGTGQVQLKGLNHDEVQFYIVNRQESNGVFPALQIKIKDTGETITIRYGAYNAVNQIKGVEFADGTWWTYAEIMQNGVYGMDDGNTMTLNQATNFFGGAGNDTITGSSGNDQLYGGAGNDTLCGGAGDDTYIFGRGDGQDTINNTGGGDDLLQLLDINPAELWFGKSGNHLTINLIGSTDKITVNNWYASGDYKIDTIQAGDYAITESQVQLMVQAMATVGTPGGAEGQWTQEQQDALQPILSTYWQRAA